MNAGRYAFFTMVGIAGEDDFDAPDLPAPTSEMSAPGSQSGNARDETNGIGNGNWPRKGNGHVQHGRAHHRTKINPVPSKPSLSTEESAVLCEQLLAELNGLVTADDAALLAKRILPEKNKLTVADAQRIEEAFAARLAVLVDLGEAVSSLNTKSEDRPQERPLAIAGAPVDQESMRRENGIDKACCLSQSRAESVTGTTSDTWPNSPVLSADGHPAMPTTSASPNAGRSAKRSVTSSPSRCVAVTIARFTVAVTKQDGGVELQLIPLLQPADFGSKRTR